MDYDIVGEPVVVIVRAGVEWMGVETLAVALGALFVADDQGGDKPTPLPYDEGACQAV